MYGLVLEGGGAKGAYHVGAYKALKELNIDISGVAGTSIGAINAAMIVQGDYELLEKIWYSINSYELFEIDQKAISSIRHLNINEINFSYLLHQTREILNNRGLDTTKIRNIFDTYIDEEKIRSSNMDMGIVTVNMTDKKPMELFKEDIPKGKIIDFLIASANLPAFRIDEMDGKKYLDGGFYDNLPINLLAKKGYKNIIAVRTMAIGVVRKVKDKDLNIIYIQPNESLRTGMLDSLDFNQERARELINLGYYDTIRVFKNLRGFKYYLNEYKGDFNLFMVSFLSKNKDRINNIGKLLGFLDTTEDRLLFEKILPRLEKILDMRGRNDYQDICIRLLEKIAECYDVERFKFYELEDFFEIVRNKFIENPLPFTRDVPLFVKQNKVLSLAVKNELIVEIFKDIVI